MPVTPGLTPTRSGDVAGTRTDGAALTSLEPGNQSMILPDLATAVTTTSQSVTKALTVLQVDQATIDEVVQTLYDAVDLVKPERFQGDTEVDSVGFGDIAESRSLAQAHTQARAAVHQTLQELLGQLDTFSEAVTGAGKLFSEMDHLTTADLASVEAGVETMVAVAQGEGRFGAGRHSETGA
jgi:hypothetical protein